LLIFSSSLHYLLFISESNSIILATDCKSRDEIHNENIKPIVIYAGIIDLEMSDDVNPRITRITPNQKTILAAELSDRGNSSTDNLVSAFNLAFALFDQSSKRFLSVDFVSVIRSLSEVMLSELSDLKALSQSIHIPFADKLLELSLQIVHVSEKLEFDIYVSI
jgi:hypothetical protein